LRGWRYSSLLDGTARLVMIVFVFALILLAIGFKSDKYGYTGFGMLLGIWLAGKF